MTTPSATLPVWSELLELARWTPSPHNTQPWKVRGVSGGGVDVCLDPERALPDEDVTGCFILAALAMYVEALRILAGNRRLRLTVGNLDAEAVRQAATRDGARTGLVRYATVTLEEGSVSAPLFGDDVFLRRRTSRLAATGEPIEPETLAELRALAAPLGHTVHLIEDPADVAHLMRLNLDAVTADLTTPAYRDEIVRWFRYGRRHERGTRDGLSARCMNVPALELRVLTRVVGVSRWPVVGTVVRALYNRRLGAVPRLMILDGPFWDAESAVQAGTCLMRLWLALERRGLRIHPFGNLVTNAEANRALRDRTGTRAPWIVFRVGRTAEPPRSERLRLEEVCVG